MRQLIFFAVLCASLSSAIAQVPFLHLSPTTSTQVSVATTELGFTYSRPSMRGRVIFGGLEPYDKIWRGGANRNPKLTISQDVLLGDQRILAGSYTLFHKPNPENWTVYLYDEVDEYGVPPAWDETKVIARMTLQPTALATPVETLLYTFEELSNDHFTIVMEWERTRVEIPFRLTTAEQMDATIAKTLAGPTAGDYSNAGMYAFRDAKDYKQAVTYFDKAIELQAKKPNYWPFLFKAQALEKLGRKDAAKEAATRALSLAEERNSEYGIKESQAVLTRLR